MTKKPGDKILSSPTNFNDRKVPNLVRSSAQIKRVEIERPIGKPICAPLSHGLWEVRVTLENRIARVIFCVHDGTMVLLHGFIKKTQKTPQDDLDLAARRKRDLETADAKGKS